MKRWICGLMLLGATGCVWAGEDSKPPRIPSGIEWMQSMGEQKREGLVAALLTIRSSGVEMNNTVLEYEDALRRHLLRRPELQQKPLTTALADYLYESDPAARVVLEQYRVSGKKSG